MNTVKYKKIIEGVIGGKGKAKGKIKLVLNSLDAKKIKQGDILVTSMTTPQHITAMKKAAAFVTDEGGLLCHAAIIAREMKKPCIVGTTIATQIFKDDDFVEVDANKGTVKILK